MDAGFRWFVGLDWDDKVFDHSTLSFNRERLFWERGHGGFARRGLRRLAKMRRLLASDRLVVDGTLVKAWAGHKGFQPTDGPREDRGFKGQKRPYLPHESSSESGRHIIYGLHFST